MRGIAVVLLAGALAGCASVSSHDPVFAPAPEKSAFAGVYGIPGEKGAISLLVRRRDASSYEAFLFDPEEPHEEGMAAEFSVVPLGVGDYALQVSCIASRKDDGKGPWEMGPPGFLYWTLAMARPHGDYWLGFNLTDAAAAALSAKYKQTHGEHGIELAGLPPDRARAFFSDWLGMQIAEGGDRVLPVMKKLDASSDDAQFKNPTTCRQAMHQ
ncbi:MAG TPA: hypothetical protein VGF56_10980 [Rhizomicrobium sp.]|jgi:hypothetical protein